MIKKILYLVLILLIVLPSNVYAHPNMQEGIIEFGYDVHDLGWNIFDNGSNESIPVGHCNAVEGNVSIHFRYDSNSLTDLEKVFVGTSDTYKDLVIGGAVLWNNTNVCFISKNDDNNNNPYGTIQTENSYSNYYARLWYENTSYDSDMHYSCWGGIKINIPSMEALESDLESINISTSDLSQRGKAIMAHEFGHGLGLAHVLTNQNKDKLMYDQMGYSSPLVTGPTQSDIKGLKVITGQHTTHSFSWQSIDSSQHKNVCNICDGYSVKENHIMQWNQVYVEGKSSGHVNKCSKCGYIQPNSADIHQITYVQVIDPQTGKNIGHSGGPCAICGYDPLADTHNMQWVQVYDQSTGENLGHNGKCTICTYDPLADVHNYNDASDTLCNDCGYLRTPPTVCTHIYTDCNDSSCNNCNYIRVTPGHSYTTPPVTSDGTDATCNNCSYERLSVSVTAPSPSGSYYTSQTISINGSANIKCYRMTASITKSGGSETWLGEQYNTLTYSHNYTLPSPGTYTIKVVARDLNTTYSGSISEYSTNTITVACNHPIYSYGTWLDVSTSSICEKRLASCNYCPNTYWVYDESHAWTDCEDTICNDCGYSRTAPGHSYTSGSWLDVTTSGTCEKQLRSCNNCPYSYWNYDYIHSWTDCNDTICNDCGYTRTAPGHSYTSGSWLDVTTSGTCEKQLRSCNNCSYSYWSYDYTHAWTNCTDTVCNDCSYTRTAPGHSYSFSWVDVSTSGTCEKLVGTCSTCGNSYISSYDYTHAYTDCIDSVCNDCRFTRAAPGHSYSYGAWTDVSTSGTCEKQLRSCTNCSYSYWYYDYTHAWSNDCDTRCNDCTYTRSVSGHTYNFSWVDVRTTSTCEKLVGTCTKCSYSYVSSYDYTHAYDNSSDRVCNDCGYIR